MLELAQAAMQCFDVQEAVVAQNLASEFGEGEEVRRELPNGVLVLYRNVKTDSWSLVWYPRPGVACPTFGTGTPPDIVRMRDA